MTMGQAVRAVLGLGANLGDRAAALQSAVDALAGETNVVAVSAIFETVPVGGPPQPDFYNAVVIVASSRYLGQAVRGSPCLLKRLTMAS